MSAICFLPERYCGTYRACLCFLAFLFLSFYCDNILSVELLCEHHAFALVVVYTCFYFVLYFVYDQITVSYTHLTLPTIYSV